MSRHVPGILRYLHPVHRPGRYFRTTIAAPFPLSGVSASQRLSRGTGIPPYRLAPTYIAQSVFCPSFILFGLVSLLLDAYIYAVRVLCCLFLRYAVLDYYPLLIAFRR